MKEYDIIITGAGMVGLAFACALAKHTELKIAIIEAQTPTYEWPHHFYPRVSAIALSSMRIFQSLGVWDEIKNMRVSPYTHMYVWEANNKGKMEFNCQDIKEPSLGFIIENKLIEYALFTHLKQYKQVDFLSPEALCAFEYDQNTIVLTTNKNSYRAKLAVAADGANSFLRQLANIDTHIHNYYQQAIVATVKTELPHNKIASQIFLPQGPLAFLPLSESNWSSIVWSVPQDEATRLLSLHTEVFHAELAEAFDYRLGKILEVKDKQGFPLIKRRAQNYIKPRIALIGDAAHTVHPLAGQGVNIGLLDAAALAEVLIDVVNEQDDIGNIRTLRHYERWRKADNALMLTGIDNIQRLFASSTMSGLRSTGMSIINHLNFIKNKFVRHAVGNRNGLPKLAKEVSNIC